MRKILNTLYVTSPDRYLSLDGQNIVVKEEKKEIARFPMHNFEAIVTFGYTGASPALMGACAEKGIDLTFMTRSGKFLATVVGESKGNVVLRKQQYRISDDETESLKIARNMIIGKVYNSRWVLERAKRDHPMRVDVDALTNASNFIQGELQKLPDAESLDSVRGIEGSVASEYFSVFDELILQNKDDFYFRSRNKRPPLDNVNALLSFVYSMLAKMCGYALSSVGLDPYVGFLHTDRPGRASLALDLMEEFRSIYADRFVLTLINKRIIEGRDFVKQENGAVVLKDTARKELLAEWQRKKQEEITHPFLEQKIPWGLVPFAQAMLLARYIRGDLDEYPPFLWK
jgi:CRISP-associated protein Cas1